ncbi:hypothetical protein TNCV_70681 [Trichonephila clavipes]|nr:hypothetical protein TNCV_70681 [Trichonephila clavipes]
MYDVFGEVAVTARTCKRWFAKFQSGNSSLKVEPISERPSDVSDEVLSRKMARNQDILVGEQNPVISHWKEGKSVRGIGKLLKLISLLFFTSLTGSRKQIVLKTSKSQGVQRHLMNVKRGEL